MLVGINLLREGLDIPEVSLVAILDADKEGFLRSERSLIQTIGRAARNLNGKAILYADSITKSMEKAITETNRRREKQMKYNEENGIVPQALNKKVGELLDLSLIHISLVLQWHSQLGQAGGHLALCYQSLQQWRPTLLQSYYFLAYLQ